MSDLPIFVRWRGAEAKAGIGDTKREVEGLKTSAGGARDHVRALWQQFSPFAGMAGVVGAAVVAWQGLSRAIGEAKIQLQGYLRELESTKRMELVLARTGAGPGVAGSVAAFAQQKQFSVRFDDEAIVAGYRRMVFESQNVQKSTANLMTMLDLAEAAQVDLQTAAHALAGVFAGQTRQIGMMIPALRTQMEALEGVEDKSQRAALALKSVQDYTRGAAEEMGKVAGVTNEAKKQWDELWQYMMEAAGTAEFVSKWDKFWADRWEGVRKGAQSMFGGGTPRTEMPYRWLQYGPDTEAKFPSGNWQPEYKRWMEEQRPAGGPLSPWSPGDQMPGIPIPGDARSMPNRYGRLESVMSFDREIEAAREAAQIRNDSIEKMNAAASMSVRQLEQYEATLASALRGAFLAARGGARNLARYLGDVVYEAMADALARSLAQSIIGSIFNVASGGIAGAAVGALGLRSSRGTPYEPGFG